MLNPRCSAALPSIVHPHTRTYALTVSVSASVSQWCTAYHKPTRSWTHADRPLLKNPHRFLLLLVTRAVGAVLNQQVHCVRQPVDVANGAPHTCE